MRPFLLASLFEDDASRMHPVVAGLAEGEQVALFITALLTTKYEMMDCQPHLFGYAPTVQSSGLMRQPQQKVINTHERRLDGGR
jgi:hypothetical protein